MRCGPHLFRQRSRGCLREEPPLANVLFSRAAGGLRCLASALRPFAASQVCYGEQRPPVIRSPVEYSGWHAAPCGLARGDGRKAYPTDAEKIQKRVEFDFYYIENWSVLFDLYILCRTPLALLKAENAY